MRPLLLAAPLLALLLAGCNPRDASELGQDAGKLGKTALRAAGNAQLAGQVNVRLAQTKGVDMTNLKVESEGGTITLNGRVRTKEERAKVLSLTQETRGVDKVVNNLVVGG